MALIMKAVFVCIFFLNSLLIAGDSKFSFANCKEHSTIGFLGDSITQGTTMTKDGRAWTDDMDESTAQQGGLYHQYIQLFLAVRYPGKDIWTVNLGHAGAKSDGAIQRLAYDVYPYKLDTTFIHFGMNDFRYFLYLDKKTIPNEKRKLTMRQAYVQNMTSLVDKLQGKGSKVVLLSPTIYDEFQKSSQQTAKGAQAELKVYAKLSEELAKSKNLPFVNLSNPMLTETERQQEKNPKWSFTKDRVHPAEKYGGSEFMAFHILKHLEASGLVYDLDLTAEGKVEKCENAKLANVRKTADGLSFSLHEYALPFPLLKSDYGFTKLVPFQKQLNRQILRVKGLAPAKYSLSINDRNVAEISAEEFSSGVNLSGNAKTPQYQLARSVRKKIIFRKAVLEQRVRVVRNNLRFVLKEIKGIDWSDPESVLSGVEKFKKLKAKRAEKIQGWQAYLISTASYTLPRYKSTIEELKDIRKSLRELPKERVYKYEIKKVN